MRRIWGWMSGRKTYLVAGAVLFVLAALVFLGKLTPDTGVALVTVAACGFGATFRHALERHQQEEIAILRGIAQTGEAAASRNASAAIQDAASTAFVGAKLAAEIRQEDGR